jgi:glucose/arabinose dehydrogenase
MTRLVTLVALATLVLAGCGGESEPEAGDTPTPSPSATSSEASPTETDSASPSESPTSAPPSATPTRRTARPRVLGTVARNLEAPWGVAFLPDGTALVTERDTGRVFRIGRGEVVRVGRVEQSEPGGEAGLLGVAVSPSYDEDRRVFLYTTASDDNRVLRGTLRGNRLRGLRPILTGIPKASNHDGGRMIFGPDGMLYVSTGEAGQPELAQDMGSLGGKILRITQDGRPAPGNPGPDSPIWTSGHRKVQGLAFDDDGNLWASEFGQNTWDELNLIRKGRNYGWPRVEGKGGGPDLEDPQIQWSTDVASPSGLAYAGGRLYLGALRGERLWRIDVNGRRASRERAFFVGDYGRMRTVVTAPDGNLWLTTSNRDGRGDPADVDDRILLVRP